MSMAALDAELGAKALRHELTAVNQYWLHYRLLDNWVYKDLAKQWRKESIEDGAR
jgi:bacterioferritin